MSASPATLILLPGLDGTEIFFRPLLAALPPWIRARCVEYPTWGPNDYGDLLPLVRDACRACDDFFLLGWSFSGPLALMMAAESPGALRGVILCASFIAAPWPFLRVLRGAVTAPVARLFPVVSRALALFGRYSSRDFRRDRLECLSRVPPSVFEPPAESSYPLTLRHGRTLTAFHGFYDHGLALPSLAKADPEPVLWISPADAASRGVADGAAITMRNARGEMHCRAHVTPRIPTGTVWMRDGWSELNTLTSGDAVLPDAAVDVLGFSAGQASFDARVEVAPVVESPART